MTIKNPSPSASSQPRSSEELLKDYGLQKHPEGGYFKETYRANEETPSPFADGKKRSLATCIYYLLTRDSPYGYFHLNKSHTMHLHHQGRALYTLIRPPTSENPRPKIEQHVLGPDDRQLLVEGGWWKNSRLLDDGDGEENCLISEVVFPGFDFEDHSFLSRREFESIFANEDEETKKKATEEWGRFIRPDEKN